MGVKFSLDIPKIGYIMATRYDKYNLFSNIIYKHQKDIGFTEEQSRYTHVTLSSGGPHVVNIMPPRSRLVNITRYYKGTYVKFLRYKGVDFDNKNRYKIAVLYNALCSNKRYDYAGALSFIIGWIKQFSNRPFCSEGVTEAYQMVYPEFLRYAAPNHVLPAEFIKSDSLEIVWEGVIS